jgi:hypothetical protein
MGIFSKIFSSPKRIFIFSASLIIILLIFFYVLGSEEEDVLALHAGPEIKSEEIIGTEDYVDIGGVNENEETLEYSTSDVKSDHAKRLLAQGPTIAPTNAQTVPTITGQLNQINADNAGKPKFECIGPFDICKNIATKGAELDPINDGKGAEVEKAKEEAKKAAAKGGAGGAGAGAGAVVGGGGGGCSGGMAGTIGGVAGGTVGGLAGGAVAGPIGAVAGAVGGNLAGKALGGAIACGSLGDTLKKGFDKAKDLTVDGFKQIGKAGDTLKKGIEKSANATRKVVGGAAKKVGNAVGGAAKKVGGFLGGLF